MSVLKSSHIEVREQYLKFLFNFYSVTVSHNIFKYRMLEKYVSFF